MDRNLENCIFEALTKICPSSSPSSSPTLTNPVNERGLFEGKGYDSEENMKELSLGYGDDYHHHQGIVDHDFFEALRNLGVELCTEQEDQVRFDTGTTLCYLVVTVPLL